MSKIVLAALGIDGFFTSVIGGDVLPVKKPDAGHIHAVLDAMGCARDAAVFVGDSPTDVAAAHNTALPVIAVSSGYSKVSAAKLGADILIDRFADLPGALARLGANAGSA